VLSIRARERRRKALGGLALNSRIAFVFLCVLTAVSRAYAHDHTLAKFQRQRAEARAAQQQQTEPAPPRNAETACRLTVELLVDGRLSAGLLRVTNIDSGKAISLSGEIHRELNWYAVESGATVTVPQTKLRLEAFHGLNTELTQREIDLAGQTAAKVQIPLRKFYDPAERGLRAGNTHLHLMRLTFGEAERYLRIVPQCDGLDLVFLSHLRRTPEDREYISNVFTDADLGRLSLRGALYGNGQEHRHNFGPGGEGFGHVMFLNIQKLIEPVSIGPGIMKEGTDGIPLQRGIREARRDGAAVIWCHNTFGHEDIPNWVAGLLDAQNIHDGGEHGGYADTYYRYLNVGMKVPFSTGTDWFIYDFSRVYTPVAGELTSRKWLDSLAAGKSYITNGVFLEFAAAGKSPGDTIQAKAGDEAAIVARGISRHNFGHLELIYNGDVVHTTDSQPEGEHFTANIDFPLRLTEPGWIALRIPDDAAKNEFGKPLFAHTSPIYVEIGGRRIFREAVARELIAEMEQSMTAIEKQGKFAGDEEMEGVLRVYREGIAAIQKRIESKR
jgi:hypothetical protein